MKIIDSRVLTWRNRRLPTSVSLWVRLWVHLWYHFELFCGKLPRPNRFGKIFFENRELTQILSQVFFELNSYVIILVKNCESSNSTEKWQMGKMWHKPQNTQIYLTKKRLLRTLFLQPTRQQVYSSAKGINPKISGIYPKTKPKVIVLETVVSCVYRMGNLLKKRISYDLEFLHRQYYRSRAGVWVWPGPINFNFFLEPHVWGMWCRVPLFASKLELVYFQIYPELIPFQFNLGTQYDFSFLGNGKQITIFFTKKEKVCWAWVHMPARDR